MSCMRKMQKPTEVMKEIGRLYNLFVKRRLDERGFPLGKRKMVLKRRYATIIPLDVDICNRIIKLVKSKCYHS